MLSREPYEAVHAERGRLRMDLARERAFRETVEEENRGLRLRVEELEGRVALLDAVVKDLGDDLRDPNITTE